MVDACAFVTDGVMQKNWLRKFGAHGGCSGYPVNVGIISETITPNAPFDPSENVFWAGF